MNGRSFTELFDDIAAEICDNYCKHLEEHMQDDDDGEQLMSEHCEKCPLNRCFCEKLKNENDKGKQHDGKMNAFEKITQVYRDSVGDLKYMKEKLLEMRRGINQVTIDVELDIEGYALRKIDEIERQITTNYMDIVSICKENEGAFNAMFSYVTEYEDDIDVRDETLLDEVELE